MKNKNLMRGQVCSDGALEVAFHAHEDDTLLTVCSYIMAENATKEISNGTNFRRIKLLYEIKNIVLTSKGKIFYNISISDSSYS